mmetsp:Transcript_33166/g.43688  ORF Transcript_33166/g.43688 Transcript_33166/m.43688 type:complete len:282 (+) Transcript_33166:1289-2134(+)
MLCSDFCSLLCLDVVFQGRQFPFLLELVDHFLQLTEGGNRQVLNINIHIFHTRLTFQSFLDHIFNLFHNLLIYIQGAEGFQICFHFWCALFRYILRYSVNQLRFLFHLQFHGVEDLPGPWNVGNNRRLNFLLRSCCCGRLWSWGFWNRRFTTFNPVSWSRFLGYAICLFFLSWFFRRFLFGLTTALWRSSWMGSFPFLFWADWKFCLFFRFAIFTTGRFFFWRRIFFLLFKPFHCLFNLFVCFCNLRIASWFFWYWLRIRLLSCFFNYWSHGSVSQRCHSL